MIALRRLGRRGILLLIFGVLWVVFGFGVIVTPAAAGARFSGTGPQVPVVSLLDSPASGWFWIVAGIGSVVVSLMRIKRYGHDAAGFNCLLGPAFVWFLAYIWSSISWVVTEEYGRPTAWVAAVVWLIVCVFIVLVAGWPDPDDPAMQHTAPRPEV